MTLRRGLPFLMLTLSLLAGCEREKPQPSAPAAQARREPAPIESAIRPARKPAGPQGGVEAGRKAGRSAPEEAMKEVVDLNAPEVVNSKLPVVLYYYADWSTHDKMLMGVVEEVARAYKGKARFFRINVDKAREAKALPPEVTAFPYMIFMRQGKERQSKLARPGEARKEIEFFIEEWLSD
ncbi:MAG: thioredoxin family protein [Elusimicrobia bacterium]|nr:thioredoxin family protein [Elusimicrobiota bacterium]